MGSATWSEYFWMIDFRRCDDSSSSSSARRCSVMVVPRCGALDRLDREIALARAFPAHAFSGRQTGAARFDRDLVRDDKARIEAHAELADQRRIFLLVAGELAEEFLGARAGDRAEVRDRFVAAHADAVVVDRDGARGLVVRHANPQIRIVFVQRAVFDRFEAQLVGGVRGVRNQLTQENFLVAVQRMDHQLQKLFHFCLKAHGFLCHGRTSSLFVAVDSGQAWRGGAAGLALGSGTTRGAGAGHARGSAANWVLSARFQEARRATPSR